MHPAVHLRGGQIPDRGTHVLPSCRV